jgi:Pyruvate/2-oxoacid:ferredoxin oxidoreductase delta subunit
VCEDSCQFSAIAVDEESETAVVDVKECMGCEICRTRCPEDAVSLVRNPHVSLDPVDLSAIRAAHRA